MMTKRRILLITGSFFLILTIIRIIWFLLQTPSHHLQAIKGELDLRNWDFSTNRTLLLDGEWEFYPHVLLQQDNKDKQIILDPGDKVFIQVPGNWNSALSTETNSTFGYGTYRLRILIHPDKDRLFSIRLPSIPTSSELIVNGRLLAHKGLPAPNEEQYTAGSAPYSASFATDQNEIEIIIRAANYVDTLMGGLSQPIKFGTASSISKSTGFSIATQLAVCLIFLMHIIYVFIFYWIGARQRALLYFVALIVCAIFSILIDDDRILPAWTALNYTWMVKIYYLAFLGGSVFLVHYTKAILPEFSPLKGTRLFTYICAIYCFFVLILPVRFLMLADLLHMLLVLIPFLILPIIMFRAARNGNPDAVYLMLGATAITNNMIWAVIKNLWFPGMSYYPIDMVAGFVAMASFWFKSYFRTSILRNQLTDKLQKSDKLKDDFLLNTSHELRTPLHGMLNIAQAVLDSEGRYDEGKNKEHMKLLVSVGKRMSFLLNDLLDLTMLKEHRIRLQLKSLQVQTVATGVIDMVRFMTEGKPLQLINTIPDRFPAIIADENRLIQILFNLLHNAVKFTNEGTITIEAQIVDDKAHIFIRDTGIGMHLLTQQRIFLPYEQGEVEQTASVVGLGLGLSICKQLVELHQGSLSVSSVLGQGSVFTLILPLSDDVSFQPAESELASLITLGHLEAAASGLGSVGSTIESTRVLSADRPQILVIDDDPINLSILASVLTIERYNIITATSGKDALAILNTREWDLIITDVMMPYMSGYEVTRTIRERFSISELPILLLTARNRPEDIDAGFLAGANDYVTKPVDATELKSRVRAMTEINKSIRDRLRMEGAWLQAQIQPHFLFNTLNAIAALSEFDTDRMRSLLVEFGNYLKGSFDFRNSERLIQLSHELDLVRSYLYIEGERFEERLQVTWDLDENLALLIPPLSIQPLVENAIRHGIMKRTEGGSIHIKITDLGDYAEISVADDGVGIGEHALQNLLNKHSARKSGIGLINTDRRLKQLYGNGLQIQSSLDQGTTVTFMVKK